MEYKEEALGMNLSVKSKIIEGESKELVLKCHESRMEEESSKDDEVIHENFEVDEKSSK